jgi:serine/threonine protein kinase
VAEIDEGRDVYGLGALLYAGLRGRPPFAGGSAFDLLAKVVREPPVPPRTLRPEIPSRLDEICLKALAKRPADRCTSAAALAEALEQPEEVGAARGKGRSHRRWDPFVLWLRARLREGP